jgi:hypothetical protein
MKYHITIVFDIEAPDSISALQIQGKMVQCIEKEFSHVKAVAGSGEVIQVPDHEN